MLFAHADDPGIGADHEHAEVRRVTRHPEDGRLQVFLVAGQVDERDHLVLMKHEQHAFKEAQIIDIERATNKTGKTNESRILRNDNVNTVMLLTEIRLFLFNFIKNSS